jgi:hypothetical protein
MAGKAYLDITSSLSLAQWGERARAQREADRNGSSARRTKWRAKRSSEAEIQRVQLERTIGSPKKLSPPIVVTKRLKTRLHEVNARRDPISAAVKNKLLRMRGCAN